MKKYDVIISNLNTLTNNLIYSGELTFPSLSFDGLDDHHYKLVFKSNEFEMHKVKADYHLVLFKEKDVLKITVTNELGSLEMLAQVLTYNHEEKFVCYSLNDEIFKLEIKEKC